jgi:acyl phosphate:glycerol-3-phosphate acyltransferase
MATMSDDALVALLVPVAYLLGTFPSAEVVARRRGVDVRTAGSGNPGASNTFRLLGWKAGALVLGLDAAKGAAAALAGLLVEGRAGALVLGVAAVVGHMLPVTRRFKGGRGVATGAGVLLVLYPFLVVGAGVLWFAIVGVTRKASLASIVTAIAVPVGAWVTGEQWWEVAALAALAALVVLRHASNLRRLVRGEELGLGPGRDERPDVREAGPDGAGRAGGDDEPTG